MEARLRALAASGAIRGHDWEELSPKEWAQLDIERDLFNVKDLAACQPLTEEGFSFSVNADQRAALESSSDVVELVLNGRLLNWRLWVQQMRTLSAGQAARLMTGLDPDLYANIDARPVPDNDVSSARQQVVTIERLALNWSKEEDTALGWLNWGKEHDFQLHANFVLHVLDTIRDTSSAKRASDSSTAVAGGRAAVAGWTLKEPQRYQGYSRPLYLVLKEAHSNLQPRPRARDVLDAFRMKRPSEVIEVSHDGFSYYDSNGNAKLADLPALSEAIRRMTSSPSEGHD